MENAPTAEPKLALSTDLCRPSAHILKTVFLFHDKSTFQANDDQPTLWGKKDITVM